MTRPVVAVVGGGVAGLVAARTLARNGATVHLFEAADWLGGRCHRGASTEVHLDGRTWSFDLEHGIHGIWRQYRNLRAILDEEGLLGDLVHANAQELVMPHPSGGVRAYEFGARVRHAMVPDLLAFLTIFGAGDFAALAVREGPGPWLHAATDLLHAFAFDAKTDIAAYDDVSVADFVARWPLLLQRMTGAITHSAFFRESRDVGLSAYLTGLQSYFVSDKRDTAFDFFANDAHVDLLAPLARSVRDRGGRIHLGARVVGSHWARGRLVAIDVERRASADGTSSAATTRERVDVDGAVLAVDPPSMRRLTEAGGFAAVVEPGAVIPEGVPSVVVRLFFGRDLAADRAPTGVFHGLAADNFFWLHRLQRRFVAWHADTGGSVLECHLYGDRAVAAVQGSDAVVLAGVLDVVEQAWPELRGSLLASHILRNPATHVAFGPSVMARVPAIRTRVPNVALAGDWIALDSPVLYLERATTTGLLAARVVAASVGLDADRFPRSIDSFPPAPDVARVSRVARWARRRGLLPMPRAVRG